MDPSYPERNPQASASPSDEELVALAREGRSQGRRDAFEALVKRYEKPLFNYVRRMVNDTAEAEDLFQETFLRVYTHLNRFWLTGRFRPWVYRIATNLCKDCLKRRARRRQVSLDDPGPEGESLARRVEAPGANPGNHAQKAETAALLEAALEQLSPKHRAVFLMARYDGMRYEEIARALRVPVGTVKSRMNKAVADLLGALKDVQE